MHLFARLLALALLSWLSSAQAQDPPGRTLQPDPAMAPLDHLAALRGGYFPLVDEASGRTHHIYVRLPEGYEAEPGRRWPVVYLLDGDSLFPLLASTHLFLTYDEALPEAIVVGIAYGGFDPAINRRNLDFTAAGADTAPDQGGAEAFHGFLRGQLLPEVESRYRADSSRRVLLGQSRGGYFVLWSALHDPDLFWGRIASNPAAAPAREQLYRSPAPHRRADLGVVVASGARDTAARVAHAKEWAATWSARADAPWRVELSVLPDGTHAASIGEAYRRAMLWLFDEGRVGPATPPRP